MLLLPNGELNGRTLYQSGDGGHAVGWDGSAWGIYDTVGEVFTFISAGDQTSPWTADWTGHANVRRATHQEVLHRGKAVYIETAAGPGTGHLALPTGGEENGRPVYEASGAVNLVFRFNGEVWEAEVDGDPGDVHESEGAAQDEPWDADWSATLLEGGSEGLLHLLRRATIGEVFGEEVLATRARQFGFTETNREGYFRTRFNVLEGTEEPYPLRFTFQHPELPDGAVAELSFDPADPRTPVQVDLEFQPLPSTSHTIAETGVDIPADVSAYLAGEGITVERLEDIRRIGGFRNLPTAEVDKEDPDLLRLDALAALEVLTGDLEAADELADLGYTSPSRIANASRKTFMEDASGLLGDFGAARLHYQAQAAHLYALNNLAAGLAGTPKGGGGDEEEPGTALGTEALPTASACNCPDCSSAVSPLAYLADLLSFTLNKVENDGSSLTLDFLKDTFFQEFGRLAASCEQLKRTLCQNRIAAEVLRKYYASLEIGPEEGPALELAAAEKEYLANTYELLLNKLGTSYAELRRARAITDPAERKRLTDRLGIVAIDDEVDTLEELLIDLSDPDNITEALLEELFGLRNSMRDTRTDTPESKVERWKKARLREIWKEQHALRNEFWNPDPAQRQAIIDPDVVTVDDLRHPEAGNNAFDLWLRRRNWLDGNLLLTEATFPAPLIDHRAHDNAIVLYEADPGLLTHFSPEDTFEYTNEDPSFTRTYTVESAEVVEGNIEVIVKEAIDTDRGGGAIIWGENPEDPEDGHQNTAVRTFDAPNFPGIFQLMFDGFIAYPIPGVGLVPLYPNWGASPSITDLPDLFAFLNNLAANVRSGASGTAGLLANLNLRPDELLWLVDFINGYKGFPTGVYSENNYDLAKWHELRDILLNVFKRLAKDTWTEEEADLGIALGPMDFWASVAEPKAGPWPILDEGIPLVDPELIGLKDLPEITVRNLNPFTLPQVPHQSESPDPEDIILPEVEDSTALTTFHGRRDTLAAARESIQTAYATGYMAMLGLAFGEPSGYSDWSDYLALLDALASAESREEATTTVEGTFRITVQEFTFVVETGRKRFAGETVPQRDLDRLFTILTGAYKRIVLYPAWIEQEHGEQLMAGLIQQQWKLRKARLPKWRAPAEQRRAWLSALAENSQRPIIDADLIGPGDLKYPVASDPAFALWNERWEAMHATIAEHGFDGWLTEIAAATGGALASTEEFDALTGALLHHAEAHLAILRVQQEAGIDIRPRMAQLNLTSGEFNQLMACRDILAASPGTLTAEEKTSVHRILATATKRRHFFTYRLEEQEEGITLSQDSFRIREQPVVSFPPVPEYPLKTWLAEERDLILWRRELRGRIEQENSALDAWRETLHEVDEAMVVHLRDALARACGSHTSLFESPRQLGDRLLMDIENNCCYKTNRVAAAIETLQQLLWKTRTNDIRAHHPDIRYTGEDFDEAWTWMGSYANWRAAMFVFLYPENVLHPSLRRNQTPAFQRVVEATRNNRRFGPEDACAVAREYRQYMEDVADLEVKCVAEAEAFVEERGCGTLTTEMKRFHFVFAQARKSHRPYFTKVDANDRTDVRQTSFWEPIPNLDEKTRVFGCAVYFPHNTERFIYLFYRLDDPEQEDKFHALRFDLDKGRWEDEPLEFQVEIDDLTIEVKPRNHSRIAFFKKEDFSPRIKAIAVRHINRSSVQPTIAISLEKVQGDAQGTYTFYWPMHENGKEFKPRWGGDGWRLSVNAGSTHSQLNGGMALFGEIRSFQGIVVDERYAELDHSVFVLTNFWNPSQPVIIRSICCYVQIFGDVDGNHWTDTVHKLPFFGEGITDVVQFYDERTLHVETGYDGQPMECTLGYQDQSTLLTNGALSGSRFGQGTRLHAPVSSDSTFNAEGGFLVHQINGTGHPIMFSFVGKNYDSSSPIDSTMSFSGGGLRLTPVLSSIPVIQSGFTDAELSARHAASREALLGNLDPNFRLAEYVQEGYFFVPLQIALQLQANGHHQAALDWFRTIYDHTRPVEDRKIWYGLVHEESLPLEGNRVAEWYADPLNPHAIAATRPHAYTRYVVLSIVYCLLDYADAEFTADTSETVPRARELYEDALDLLGLLVPDHRCPIDAEVDELLDAKMLPPPWEPTWRETLLRMEPLVAEPGFGELLAAIAGVMEGSDPIGEQLAAVTALIEAALEELEPETFEEVLDRQQEALDAWTAAALGSERADTAVLRLSGTAATAFDQTMTAVTGLLPAQLESEDIPWLMDPEETSPFEHGHEEEFIDPGKGHVLTGFFKGDPADGFLINSRFPHVRISGMNLGFCVVPNPIIGALVMKAEVELWKIRNCMNIAGMVRELDPFAAPTDSTTGIPVIGAGGGTLAVPNARSIPPSAYRYRVLVDRARQLVSMAQQVEAAFLATLEKLDAERYSQLRAEQDIATSKATIKLQDLKVTEAKHGVELARLQKERVVLQVEHFDGLLDRGNTALEIAAFSSLSTAAAIQITSSIIWGSAAIAAAFDITSKGASLGNAASGAGMLANSFSTTSQLLNIFATYERRREEWRFQLSLAQKDEQVSNQQITIAQDRERIVGQERQISVLQNEHAQATLDFLKNKFTSAELYEWMSKVLEDAYAWFLQEATAMAILAQRQLAFERQIDLPPFIRTDYWVVDGGSMGGVELTGQGAVDRRGLTGSTRLLKDLTELDQYAFNTNSPKLQLSKTISLNEIAPEELMALRDRSIANFRTTHEMFDRDYPGHYLRLIKKVSVTVIALNSPIHGIRATLTNGGVSRVWTGGTLFQERVINRLPEQIALSGGVSDYGVFQLQGEGEFLNPFEGTGVDTQWEFRMEKAANSFDYGSIADVLITIEYEAMNSFLWRNTAVQRLNSEPASAALAISMKHNLQDQWHDLHNPEQTETPYAVSFQINERDLMPNITEARISAVMLYFVMKDDTEFGGVVTLGLGEATFSATPNENLISTRANGQGFATLVGEYSPVNIWAFELEDNQQTRNLLAEDKIGDILIVFVYNGDGVAYSL